MKIHFVKHRKEKEDAGKDGRSSHMHILIVPLSVLRVIIMKSRIGEETK